MQPYFLPYIGYFQLIAAVDLFIVYDKIKYTKKGWINRNRILRNGEAAVISLPLKAGSDTLDIVDRHLALDYNPRKLLSQIENAYREAPYFKAVFPVVEVILRFPDHNLFNFLRHSIEQICAFLRIETVIRCSSSFEFPADLRGQDKVLALCDAAGADVYVNPIGGTELYAKPAFAAHGVDLRFLHSTPFSYPQFGAFVPSLSILDVVMFNPPERLEALLRSGWTAE